MPTITAGATTTSLRDISMSYTTTWNHGSFSPGMPLLPAQEEPVRAYDFPVGINLQWTPRVPEAFGFPSLRSFANVELVRLAIETRKDQIERMDWRVKKIGAKRTDPTDPAIVAATKFLRKPDQRTHFAVWLRKLVEDLLVLDAPALEIRKTRAGKLYGLDVIDGSTIKLLVDPDGRTPIAPEPAYQQIIKGRIWTTLTTEEMIYAPRNVRPGHFYGFGPVEQIIVTINTLLQRQASQLAHFSASNIPAGILNAPDGWTPEQIKQYQDLMDAVLTGNVANRAKLMMAPSGSKYQSFKDAPIKDDFDEWLARIVAFAFSLPPTPFVKQVNRDTSQADQERALQEGLSPLLNWAKRLMDDVIQDLLGFHDLEFTWETPADIDPETQSKIDDMDLSNGTRTLNEVRDARGLDPYPNALASTPLMKTANGYVPIDAYLNRAEETVDPKQGEEPVKPEKAEYQ